MRGKKARRDRFPRWVAFVLLVGGVAWSFMNGWHPSWRRVASPTPEAAAIVEGARDQIGDIYDASYVRITYPAGDVRTGRGACTDVVVRAWRNAGFDLQKYVHEDMTGHFSAYPSTWGLTQPDPNIDHRRVPNLMRFFTRKGWNVDNGPWLPGDVAFWKMPSGQLHTGIVSDRVTRSGRPLVIHNNGVCREEDVLHRWTLIGHARFVASTR